MLSSGTVVARPAKAESNAEAVDINDRKPFLISLKNAEDSNQNLTNLIDDPSTFLHDNRDVLDAHRDTGTWEKYNIPAS
jgi:hypothetical protein